MTLVDLYNRACNAGSKTAGKNTQYSLFSTPDTLYLSIEGSRDTQDWLFNLDFAVAPYKHMDTKWRVHKGFATAWRLARDQIVQDVSNTIGNRRLVCLGFSHGAALTVLAHEFFTYNGYRVESHGFGCPRVLWMPSKDIRSRFTNLILHQARGDIVTKIPPAFIGYSHVGVIKEYGPHKLLCPHTLPYYRSILEGIDV